MSHYASIKTKLDSQEALIEALMRMKTRNSIPWTVDIIEIHEVAAHLEGFQGDQREQTAEIIIRRQHVGGMANDIGFKRNEDGTWEALISDYDRAYYKGEWLQELCQTSSLVKIEMEARKRGYTVQSERLPNGKLKVRVQETPTQARQRVLAPMKVRR